MKSKTKKHLSNILFILFLISIPAVYATYRLVISPWDKEEQASPISEGKESEIMPEEEPSEYGDIKRITDGWEEYNSKGVSLRFKYPQNWEISENEDDLPNKRVSVENNSTSVTFFVNDSVSAKQCLFPDSEINEDGQELGTIKLGEYEDLAGYEENMRRAVNLQNPDSDEESDYRVCFANDSGYSITNPEGWQISVEDADKADLDVVDGIVRSVLFDSID